MSRQRLTFVEIDIPYGSCTYGVAPCAAVLGTAEEVAAGTATGTRKCFNSIKTCQDRAHFAESIVTLRFAEPANYLAESGIDAIPSITGVNFSPAIISLGENLGVRASLSVSFGDHKWPDTGPGYDKYVAERPYDPYRVGTYWGKFRARQPFLRGRNIRLIRGYLGQAIEDMDIRHYVIESTDGPSDAGVFTVTAKDILKLADGDRAQAPKVSNGFLVADIVAGAHAAVLTPTGIGDLEYPTSGWVAIGGKEVCAFTRNDVVGLDSNVKLLLHFEGADASTVITDVSAAARSGTVVGNAQFDTARKFFGDSALLLDGTGDYVTFPDHADWSFAGDFTVDCRIYLDSIAALRPIFSHSTDANNQYRLYVTTAGALTFEVKSSSSNIVSMTSANGLIGTGAFHHAAVQRVGTVWSILLDFAVVATTTDADAIPNFTSTFRIGADGGAVNVFAGTIDEFRVSHIARFTGTVTPVLAPYAATTDELYLTRAQFNTEAVDHDAQDRVQLCLYYQAVDPADINSDLFTTYADMDGDYIPLEAWQAETGAYLRRVYTALIPEPTSVNALSSELVEQAALAIWWSDRARMVRLQVLRQITTDAAVWDQSNIIEGSFSLKDQPAKRISQVWVYFGMINPLGKVDDPANYRSCEVTIATDAEADNGSPAIKKIFSRWIPAFGRSVAARLGAIQLGRFQTAPRRFNFDVFVDQDPRLGTGYQITGGDLYSPMQDDTGANEIAPMQITSLEPRNDRFRVEGEEARFVTVDDEDLSNRVIIIDGNAFNLNLRAIHDTLFPPLGEGDTVTFIINTGVIVGSTSVFTPAIDLGDWPVGFTPKLVLNGRIQGKGGDGGTAAPTRIDPQDGGPALYLRHDLDVEYGVAGQIWSGAGGGAWSDKINGAFGGGGGAGAVPGSGGGASGGSSGNIAGSPGTTESGGAAGAINAGAGGGPGLPGGNNSQFNAGETSAACEGGASGLAVDGISYINVVSGSGDVRGGIAN